ncbi:hypothetical protein DES40_2213 [Litorimonas taeanensis]|uniref:Uncharacterized protein n=1 Tax=Litorimonas taeanensis TaxID=568099 RepID=A0A420WEH9_9PROT|nr:hypothetical protein [Litorimonas taeanensis]RKQ69413.1 hypothetical protein DES40_2213 [Litorimonas taeanensis]
MSQLNLENSEKTHIDEVDAKGGRKEGVNLILTLSMIIALAVMTLIFIIFVI